MDIARKLELLADAAKYDVACTSSGVDRSGKKGQLGAATQAGCCHSFTPDGRCVTLLKVLMTNVCTCDCAYCVNRASNLEIERTAFTPRELADLTIGFYRRNFIEGLFLSSGVAGSPDNTTERMISALEILRHEYGFRGYIHAKAIPGTSPELLHQLGLLCDRLSVNMELPSAESLALLAPDKTKRNILAPMRQICDSCAEDAESRSLARRTTGPLAQRRPKTASRAFAPAGQSTQMIIGATPESDHHILNLSAALYRTLSMKRVFFSAYVPVTADPRLPQTDRVQLNREHRLYQADWLMRFYQFDVDEIIDEEDPFLDLEVDPKAAWALRHLDLFPVEVNTASYEVLLRVPGIGVRGAKLILRARRHSTLGEEQLRKLGIVWKRARYFVTCKGAYAVPGVDFSAAWLRAQLASPIDGGRHGRRSAKEAPGQMSLFDGLDAQQGHAQPAAPASGPKAMAEHRSGSSLSAPQATSAAAAQLGTASAAGLFGAAHSIHPGKAITTPRSAKPTPQERRSVPFAALKPPVEALF